MTSAGSLDLHKVWKFYRSRLSEALRSLKIGGYYVKTCGNEKQKKQVLSDSLLEAIRTSCPNIQELSLSRFYLEKISAEKLPESLVCLKLRECAWPLGWLKKATLPHLRHLDLGRTTRIDDSELSDIVKFTSIEELNLEELYRITDTGVKILCENMGQLKQLNLTSATLTDLGVHHICRYLTSLEGLDIGYSKISNSGLCNIGQSLPMLTFLSCAGTNVTDDGLKSFCYSKNAVKLVKLDISATKVTDQALSYIADKLTNLEYLNLAITKFSQGAVDDLKSALPKLEHVNLGRGYS